MILIFSALSLCKSNDAFRNEGLFEKPMDWKFENPIPSFGKIIPFLILLP